MYNEPWQTLGELIAKFGADLSDDPRRLEALLRDYAGTYRREIAVLVGAAREGVPRELCEPSEGMPLALRVGRLEKRLEDNLGLSSEASQWAVDAWAAALGCTVEAGASSGRVPGRRSAPTVDRDDARHAPVRPVVTVEPAEVPVLSHGGPSVLSHGGRSVIPYGGPSVIPQNTTSAPPRRGATNPAWLGIPLVALCLVVFQVLANRSPTLSPTAAATVQAQSSATTAALGTAVARASAVARSTVIAQASATARTAAEAAKARPPASWRVIAAGTVGSRLSAGDTTSEYAVQSTQSTNGKFVVTTKTLKGFAQKFDLAQPLPDVFNIAINMREISGSSDAYYGVAFRVLSGPTKYYYFAVNDTQMLTAQRLIAPDWFTLIAPRAGAGTSPQQTNRIAVHGEGPHYTFFVNDQYRGEAYDDQITTGSVGIFIQSTTPGEESVFEFGDYDLRAP
jgi:hypothetical protein